MRKKQESAKPRSAKGESVLKAALDLFSKHGYRRTSIDDIADAAQVAKRTVYLQYENKSALFVAMVDYLGEIIAARCQAASKQSGTPVERLYAMLDANYGTIFERFGASEYSDDLAIAGADFCAAKVVEYERSYSELLLHFLKDLKKSGAIVDRPGGLTLPQAVRLLMRAAAGAKHDPTLRGDLKGYREHLRELAAFTIAALRP